MSLFISIIVFILILAVLVVVHEFGHFIVAKKSGIRVDEFGFGFPPRAAKLFKIGETTFTLNWIPFGGFVKIYGEDGEVDDTNRFRSFVSKPKWTQALVLFAGPLFNLLFAWLLLSLMFIFGSPTLYEEETKQYMTDVHVAVVEVLPDSPAGQAGILVGDTILSLSYGSEEIAIENAEDITAILETEGVQEATITYLRNDEILTSEVTPSFGLYEQQTAPALGVVIDTVGTLRLPVHKALLQGLQKTWNLTEATVDFLVTLIKGLFSGDTSGAGAVTGPVGIVPVVGDAIQVGFSFVVIITALISINLAIINLLPFPALDGGRLLFLLIEAIKGSPIKQNTAAIVNASGFFILIGLMIWVTIRDISNLL